MPVFADARDAGLSFVRDPREVRAGLEARSAKLRILEQGSGKPDVGVVFLGPCVNRTLIRLNERNLSGLGNRGLRWQRKLRVNW